MTALFVASALSLACPRVSSGVRRPALTVGDARVSVADGARQLHLQMTVRNPNRIALTARALDWRVELDRNPPIRGRSPLDSAIPAGGQTTIEVVLPALAPAQDQVKPTSYGDYRFVGMVHFSSPRGDVAGQFDVAGPLYPEGQK